MKLAANWQNNNHSLMEGVDIKSGEQLILAINSINFTVIIAILFVFRSAPIFGQSGHQYVQEARAHPELEPPGEEVPLGPLSQGHAGDRE